MSIARLGRRTLRTSTTFTRATFRLTLRHASSCMCPVSPGLSTSRSIASRRRDGRNAVARSAFAARARFILAGVRAAVEGALEDFFGCAVLPYRDNLEADRRHLLALAAANLFGQIDLLDHHPALDRNLPDELTHGSHGVLESARDHNTSRDSGRSGPCLIPVPSPPGTAPARDKCGRRPRAAR